MMKLHQYGILFSIVACTCFFLLDIKTSCLKANLEEQRFLNRCLEQAVDAGTDALIHSYDERGLITSKEEAIQHFFTSLFSSMGIMNDKVAQETVRRYIPVIAVTEETGLHVFYHDEYRQENIKQVVMHWSERLPYVYEDEYFIYNFSLGDIIKIFDKKHLLDSQCIKPYYELDYHDMKYQPEFQEFRKQHPDYPMFDEVMLRQVKEASIIQTINKKLSFYINRYNNIAYQYGLAYQFILPTIDRSELIRSIQNPGFFVFFQGYPLKYQDEIYNRYEVAGAQIYKEDIYYIESVGWYQLYHRSSCPACKQNPKVNDSVAYYHISDCVSQGAFACKKCCPNGRHVPEYDVGGK